MTDEEAKIYEKPHFSNLNDQTNSKISIVGKVKGFNRQASKFKLILQEGHPEIEISNVSKSIKIANGDIGIIFIKQIFFRFGNYLKIFLAKRSRQAYLRI